MGGPAAFAAARRDIIALMPRACYVYCIVRSATRPATARVPAGMPAGERPSLADAGDGLWLAVSAVRLDRYGPGPLESKLRDLDWVSEAAVAHESVVEHFARLRGAVVIPMKLFTMFSSEARALADVQARRSGIEAILRHIAGCEEWGVRVSRSAGAPVPARQTGAAPTTGTAFLAARKKTRDAVRHASQQAVRAAAHVYEELSPMAKDARRREDAPPGAVPPLLDAAFLVPARARSKFRLAARRAAKACAEAGAEMLLTGPWPAYNFVQPRGEQV